jgi:hypothetical protein
MSTPTAGNFDCARLQEIKVPLSAMITPNEVKDAEYIPDVAPVNLIKSIQTFNDQGLSNPMKDTVIKGVWMDDCDDTDPEEEDSEACEISGTEIGTTCKDYELTTKFHKSFSVSDHKFRLLGNSVSQNEEVALNLAKKLKLMDELWAKKVVATMDSMSGTNLNTAPYTVTAPFTTIPPAAWNPDLFGYLKVTKDRNKMQNMKLLLGGVMEQALWKIGMETSDPTGASAARKVNSLGTVYSDSFITESVLGYKAAFLIAPSAMALITKARYIPDGSGREEISQGNKHIYYTITSPSTGIVYDVIYQRSCVNGDWINTWDIRTFGDVLTNAVFCNTSRTGVLQFKCA